jgi:hypothetical protein
MMAAGRAVREAPDASSAKPQNHTIKRLRLTDIEYLGFLSGSRFGRYYGTRKPSFVRDMDK